MQPVIHCGITSELSIFAITLLFKKYIIGVGNEIYLKRIRGWICCG